MQNVAIAVAKRDFQSIWFAKKVEASSKENKTPPTGAPKAAANPAAAPMEIRSRRSASFLKCDNSKMILLNQLSSCSKNPGKP